MTMKHSAHDRCDRDGSQAYTTWVHSAGSLLSFCGHHSRVLAAELEGQGFTLSVDDLGMLETLHGPNKDRDAASAV